MDLSERAKIKQDIARKTNGCKSSAKESETHNFTDFISYMYNDEGKCYWIDCFDDQPMDNGVWVPHYRPKPEEIVSYHGFNPSSNDKIDLFKASMQAKKTMWSADGNLPKPSDDDICPICGRKIKIIKREQ